MNYGTDTADSMAVVKIGLGTIAEGPESVGHPNDKLTMPTCCDDSDDSRFMYILAGKLPVI